MSASSTLERELADEPELLAEYERENKQRIPADYPEPDLSSLEALKDDLQTVFGRFHEVVHSERTRRYEQDTLPEKWQKNLQDGRRFFTRLTHNELLRVVAQQCRNMPKVQIMSVGDTENGRNAAQKEQRWWQQWLRKTLQDLRWRWVDAQNETGMGIYEFYVTSAYDDLDLEQKEDEGDRDYNKRTEKLLVGAKSPFGLRLVDPLSFLFDMDEDGICAVMIVEEKPRGRAKGKRSRMGEEPPPAAGVPGRPQHQRTTQQDALRDTVETYRYYDQYWYAYVVDGKVEECAPHGLPGIPVFVGSGMRTSSPNMAEGYQGICWGMGSMELAMNDLLTLAQDVQFTYSRPKWVIEQPNMEGGIMRAEDGQPKTLDLTQAGVPQLEPGQKLTNALNGFEPFLQHPVLQTIMQLWQRSGLNPVAQGESPGADTAGYTVNSLQGAAQSVYERNLDSEASVLEQVVDFGRQVVKDTIRERVYQAVPMAGRKKGSEFLPYGPDDVTEAPSVITIDPMSDVNRQAVRSSLMEGNERGFVPRRIVQMDGFGAQDPDEWDDELIIDKTKEKLLDRMVDSALARVDLADKAEEQAAMAGAPQVPPGMGGGQPGMPGMPADPMNTGAPQPPSVGAGMAAASQGQAFADGAAAGGVPMSAPAMRAGQGNGYMPPGAAG